MVSHYEVTRRWLKGKRAKGHNMFTDGKTIYSYGFHFPIAHKIGDNKVLFNITKDSVTTSKHQTIVYSEINHLKVIRCNTQEISNAVDFPKEPIIIEREHLPTDFNTIMNCLRTYCKNKGVKRFPMKRLANQIKQMVFIAQL
jgi:hypothetical protein